MTREEEILKEAELCASANTQIIGDWGEHYLGFIHGAEWADSHPHWISVEDEMPPMDKDVLVITKAKRLIIAKCRCPTPLNDWWDSDGRYMQNDKPTHWCHLPQPPVLSNSSNIGKDLKGGEE